MAYAKIQAKAAQVTALDVILQIDQDRAIQTDNILSDLKKKKRLFSVQAKYKTYTEALDSLAGTHTLEQIERIWEGQRQDCVKIANLCLNAITVGDGKEFVYLTENDLDRLGVNGREHLQRAFNHAEKFKESKT
jgi:hypothetical protein